MEEEEEEGEEGGNSQLQQQNKSAQQREAQNGPRDERVLRNSPNRRRGSDIAALVSVVGVEEIGGGHER